MLKTALQRLVGNEKTYKTYHLLREQAKSYRLVKNYVDSILNKNNISTLDWSLMGIVNEVKEGCRYVDLAQKLGVEPPFITELVNALQNKNLVTAKDDPKDKRAKLVVLTNKGKKKIEKVEDKLKESLEPVLSEVTAGDLEVYQGVMEKISKRMIQAN